MINENKNNDEKTRKEKNTIKDFIPIVVKERKKKNNNSPIKGYKFKKSKI